MFWVLTSCLGWELAPVTLRRARSGENACLPERKPCLSTQSGKPSVRTVSTAATRAVCVLNTAVSAPHRGAEGRLAAALPAPQVLVCGADEGLWRNNFVCTREAEVIIFPKVVWRSSGECLKNTEVLSN